MKSFCVNCNCETNQIVLKEEKDCYERDNEGWWEDNWFQIIKCAGCDEVSFRKLHNDAAMQSSDHDNTTSQELYPPRSSSFRKTMFIRGVPSVIRSVYLETIHAYNSELLILCAVGVRATLEAVCFEKNIKQGMVKSENGSLKKRKSLDGKIAGLVEHGYLTSHNASVLNEIRFLGNIAIHEFVEPDIQDLIISLDIIEHTIENIYILKNKGEYLRLKRNQ